MSNTLYKKKMCDIAALAGVSPSTVSRALNNSPLVNAQTRERIQSLAREHHYVINKQAQNLRLQSSKTISVMVPLDHEPKQGVSDPFFLEIIGIVADAITRVGYEVLLSRVRSDDWFEHVMSHHYVDGLIVLGQSLLHDQINEVARQSIVPMVVWGAQLPGQEYVTVGSDNYYGGYLAGEHLLDAGCRDIVVLTDISLPEPELRYRGFCQSLSERGIQHKSDLLIYSAFFRESGEQAMQVLLQSGVHFDGIFACSDVLASCATRALTAERIRVPRQVKVIGYDDIAMAAYMTPSLSTIAQGIEAGGTALVDLLFRQMAGETVENVLLPPRLIQRDTT